MYEKKSSSEKKAKAKFSGWPKKYEASDVIIVGAGPTGLMAAIDLARSDLKILVVEASSFAGGKLWMSNLLMSASGNMPQVKEILDELNIPYKKGKAGILVSAGPGACARLIWATCDAGIKILNFAQFSDLIYADDKLQGIEINWQPPLSLKEDAPEPMRISLKCQMVVDATGSQAVVCQSLIDKGLLEKANLQKVNANSAEKLLLEKESQIYPGLAVGGMAAASVYGIPQNGLNICSLLLSGRKVAQEVEMFFADNYILAPKRRK